MLFFLIYHAVTESTRTNSVRREEGGVTELSAYVATNELCRPRGGGLHYSGTSIFHRSLRKFVPFVGHWGGVTLRAS